MTKLEEWQKNPDAAKWLKDTLASPMGRFLVDVLEERSELRSNAHIPPAFLTANGPAVSGLVFGYEKCLRTIRELCEASTNQSAPLAETYGVKGPEDATE